jgi:hypothetical protein
VPLAVVAARDLRAVEGGSLRRRRTRECKQAIVISDPHVGCRLGLCPADGFALDDGGRYMPSRLQRKTWAMWREFWDEWVPRVTKGEPYAIVLNGDAIEGIHHGAVTQISHNIRDQVNGLVSVMEPEVAKAEAFYSVRGTEAHVGPSAQHEEEAARRLGAIPNEDGQHSRWELWLRIGGHLCHFLHHIGTTGSAAYEATAVYKELTESFVEAARWGEEPPQCIVRSHRHRSLRAEIDGIDGYYMAVVTPGWQAKTPFAWKIPGARLSQPQFGGILIRRGDEELYVRRKTWRLERSREA